MRGRACHSAKLHVTVVPFLIAGHYPRLSRDPPPHNRKADAFQPALRCRALAYVQ
jgi:hypothetical protein